MIDSNLIQRQIEALDPVRFVQLATDLLSEIASVSGIPRSCLATNLRLSEPDGGIDARCVGAAVAAGRFIPQSNTAYQFKSGGRFGAIAVARDDILAKPRVVECLGSGATFVYVMGWDVGDGFEDDVARIVRGGAGGHPGVAVDPGQIICISSQSFAQTLRDFPALLWQLIGAGDADLLGLEHWRATRALKNPFQLDERLDALMANIRQRLQAPKGVIRIVGAAGHGKTRLVLEALAQSDLAPSVLYARDPQALTPTFKAFLLRTPSARCTVVVDECDDAAAHELADTWTAMPSEVRLVTIGLGGGRIGRRNVLPLDGLQEATLVKVIGAVVDGLPEESVRTMARLCEGSPKLAVLLAERVRDEPALAVARRLIQDAEVQAGLAQYLPLEATDPAWRALALVAAVGNVGWSDEVESEADALFRAGGLDPDTARRHIDALHERFGIAPRAGRFRYVSPELLAIHLAGREVGSWTTARVAGILQALGARLARRFADRLRRVAGGLPNRGAFERMIFEGADAESLASLERSNLSSVIVRLAPAFPWPALVTLERLFEAATDDELREAVAIRRDLVSAIDDLMWRADTFERAAQLMLRLAVAENEPRISNNASGLLVETFQTQLGRTAAGPAARLRVLRDIATRPAGAARVLAARAVGAVVHLGHISRIGNPPDDVDGMPEEAWHPQTYGEWWDIARQSLQLLRPLLGDADPEVRAAARDALERGIQMAVAPKVTDTWIALTRSLVGAPYEERAGVANGLRREIRRLFVRGEIGPDAVKVLDPMSEPVVDPDEDESGDSEGDVETPPEQRAAFEGRVLELARLAVELAGTDFSSRLRRTVDRDNLAGARHDYAQAINRVRRDLDALAAEGLATPAAVDAEWPWLSEGYRQHAFLWAEALGKVDVARCTAEGLERYARQDMRCAVFLSLYELAQIPARGTAWVDRRAAELETTGAPSLAFDLLFRAGFSPGRVGAVARLLASGELPLRAVSMLGYAPWGPDVPVSDVIGLVEAARAGGAEVGSLLELLWQCLHQRPDDRTELKKIAIDLLSAYADVPGGEGEGGILHGHAFYEVANACAADAPDVVMRAVLALTANRDGFSGDRDAADALRAAWAAGNKAALLFDVIGPALEWEGRAGWRVASVMARFPVGEVGPEVLGRWIHEDPERRARLVAKVIGAPFAPVSDAHALLLDQFGAHGIGDAFLGALISGTFWGSAAGRTRGLMESVRPILSDPRPAVREWGERALASLHGMLESDESREEEERLRW